MRKRMLSAAMAGMMVVSMTACGGSKPAETTAAATEAETSAEESTAEETTAEAADEAGELGGTFTVGFDQDFPPMGFVGDDGEYTGFDLELAKEVADRLGLEFVPQPIAWDAKDMELSSGTIDCIWNGFTMNGREDAYTWSEPYMDNSQVFVVAADSGISSLADLAGSVKGQRRVKRNLRNPADYPGLQHRIHGSGNGQCGCHRNGCHRSRLSDRAERRV